MTAPSVRAAAEGLIDGVFGGPPCQGFSSIGRRDPNDPRRGLLGHFFRIVREVRPSFFVMENVTGLAHSNARYVLEEALLQVDEYAILGPHIWNAAKFGAATNRSRLFVIGIHKDCGESLKEEDVIALKRKPATVREAIDDLELATAVGEEDGFDVWRIADLERPSDYAQSLRSPCGLLHRASVYCTFKTCQVPLQKCTGRGCRPNRPASAAGMAQPMPYASSGYRF